MSEESFKKIYKQTRFIFWFIGVCIAFGALLGNDIAFIAGFLMLAIMSVVYITTRLRR